MIRQDSRCITLYKKLENTLSKGKVGTVKTFDAHFDGKVVVLDEPADLKPHDKVKVVAVDNDELTNDFARLSEPSFQKIWDNSLDADYDQL